MLLIMSDAGRPTRIYLAAALLGAGDLARACEAYDRVAALLRASGIDVYVPHEHTHPERTRSFRPSEVFDRGMTAIRSSDLVLALLDEPSLGVGVEVALALEEGKRVIGAYETGRRVSRFTLGLIESAPGTAVIVYDDFDDLAARVVRLLDPAGLGPD
jgi:nucleoside 2-deoxyribosyltransferase